jgi:ATP-dependent Clp protease ATP-binding subunit ClpB
MRSRQVLSLDLTSLMSSTAMRGQLEERMKGLLRDLQAVQPILFVDELHTIVNAGKTEGSMDLSNMLKPYLARGEIALVGATTLDEYRVIEKDSALARRFQSVYVAEPSVEDTISILRGIKTSYELFHGLRIQDDALVAAATLSDRYLTDRFQPDKSIDLVDEACSRLRLEQESKPEILWKKERDLLTKQIELSAIENDVDASTSSPSSKSSSRKAAVQAQVKELQDEVQRLTELWQAERKELTRVQDIKKELESARTELEQARRDGNFNRAGELMHGTIPQLERDLHDAEQTGGRRATNKPGGVMLSDSVTPDAIATIVARHTGIPVSKIASSKESSRLLNLEGSLRKRVVGQDHALEAVGNCVRLARTRLQAHNRTLGNFLFLGPTVRSTVGEHGDALVFLP